MPAPIIYIQKFLSDPDYCFKTLSNELAWVRRDEVPRMEYYINTRNTPYTYGISKFARTYEPQPTHECIEYINTSIRNYVPDVFEVCFLNRYLNQSDHLGWHADNSPEMDDNRHIAIVSLGVERDIWFREYGYYGVVEKVRLHHGSLCLMKPGMQNTHQHRIPKAGFKCGERISLTFRGYTDV